jgi:hypothetical protein
MSTTGPRRDGTGFWHPSGSIPDFTPRRLRHRGLGRAAAGRGSKASASLSSARTRLGEPLAQRLVEFRRQYDPNRLNRVEDAGRDVRRRGGMLRGRSQSWHRMGAS